MAAPKQVPVESTPLVRKSWFDLVLGAFLGLCLLKFGNPAIFTSLLTWPQDAFEWVLNNWPVSIGFGLLGVVAVLGLFSLRPRSSAPWWLVALPAVWLMWQLLASTQSINPELSRLTLWQFAGCVVCFYLGSLCLGPDLGSRCFWSPLVLSLALVIGVGVRQHFGGLEESRRYFFAYVYPTLQTVPADYLKKINSTRIFATLFYPNTLAGVLLLLLPSAGVWIWQLKDRLTIGARRFLVSVLVAGGLGCLYWSGSKGGWLLALLLALIALGHSNLQRRLRLGVIGAVMVLGLAGFTMKYAGFFQKGATSVVARFDYWRAAIQTAEAKPVFGSGPGTFGDAYKAIKKPESEMAKLAHNDYLQQASDSGVLGFVLYLSFIVFALCQSYSNPRVTGDWLVFSIWLGLLGWALQGLMEFGLHIPALGWPAFALLGWLLGTVKRMDKARPA